MMKKSVLSLVLLVLCSAVSVLASRKDEVTLLLIPREDGALRVGMDIANRYPTLLLSYKSGANGKVSLHGWTGKEWVNISLVDFQEGNFFKTGPDSALVIELDGKPVPDTLLPPVDWCGSAYKIKTTELRPLLHLVGQYYDFKYKEWQWFSENYHLSMDAINPEGLNISWYNKRAVDLFKQQEANIPDDIQYWAAIRHPQPTPLQEEEIAAEAVEQTDAEVAVKQEEPSDTVEVNPLTNAVPEAVVLGAGDAEEDVGNSDKE